MSSEKVQGFRERRGQTNPARLTPLWFGQTVPVPAKEEKVVASPSLVCWPLNCWRSPTTREPPRFSWTVSVRNWRRRRSSSPELTGRRA